MKSKIKPILDRQLSQLDWTAQDSMDMLRRIRGETKVKKKLSMALVLAMALALVAVSALAVTLWKNYYDKMAQNEGEIGYFDTWTGEQRAQFVLAMREEGVAFDAGPIAQLKDPAVPDQQKAAIATKLLTDKYQIREDVITAISILEKEKGPLPSWPMEDKIAYTRMLQRTNTLGQDEEMYLQPGAEDIAQEQAVATARKALMDAFGVDKELDGLVQTVELRAYAHEQAHRTWLVFYTQPGDDWYSPSAYEVWMTAKTGEVERAAAPMKEAAERSAKQPPDEVRALSQDMMRDFKEAAPYTVEDLVRLKRDWTAPMETLKAHFTDWGGYYSVMRNVVERDIRLPEEGALPLDEARQQAEQAVLALPGWTQDKLNAFERHAEVYYHSDALQKPLYQFIFAREPANSARFKDRMEAHDKEYLQPLFKLFTGDNAGTPLYISVRLDARTGEPVEPPVIAFPSLQGTPMALTLIQ